MTGDVFEYFFEPEELEPYYSEVLKLRRIPGVPLIGTFPVNDIAADTDAVAADLSVPDAPGGEDPSRLAGTDVEEPTENEKPGGSVGSQAEPETKTPARTRVRQFLSVHALGQFVFCARSAILAAERGDEQDPNEPLPRLTYLPNFDLALIDEMLSTKTNHLLLAMVYGGCMVALMVYGVLSQNRAMFYPSMFVFIACAMWFVGSLATILQLLVRRRAAVKAEAREIDPQVTGVQPVDWWSMLKAGFEPVNYDRPFRHPELPLEGCPWRVLERHSQRIPVIRSGGTKLGDRNGELYPKHEVRLVAYALLIEATSHLTVPYGLVFPNDSTRGLALPITDTMRQRAIETLKEFARQLRSSIEQRMEPRPPENRKYCENCSHGYPVPLTSAEMKATARSGRQMVILRGENGKAYHCECGDRFGTAPPHGKSLSLGLKASLE